MKFEERELNEYEIFLKAKADAEVRNKRLEKVILSKEEFDRIYPLAMHELPAGEIANFMNRKQAFNIQFVIEEPKVEKKNKKQAWQAHNLHLMLAT